MHQKPHNPDGGGSASTLTRKGSKFPFARSATAIMAALGLGVVAASAATTTVTGYLSYEYYPNQTNSATPRADIEAAILGGTNAPDSGGTIIGSDKGGIIPSFEAGTNFAENYVNRVFGYFIPPADGDYVFFIAADDDSDLFLSTDATPANKQLIASETGWSGVRNYSLVGGAPDATIGASSKRSDQDTTSTWPGAAGTGAKITLTHGQKYYIEAIHHEGGGGDNLAVFYKLASDPSPANGMGSSLSGSVIATDVDTAPAAGTVTITQQPTGGSLAYGANPGITLTVKATTTSPYAIGYQWFKGATKIAGATDPSYAITGPVGPAAGGSYTVQAYVPNADGTMNTVISSAAVVTVGAKVGTEVAGSLKYEYFPGKDRPGVENGSAGPAQSPGGTTGSDKSGAISIFESGTNFAENYANRISGYFIPPTTDDYTFFVASDDDGDLFLSTDDDPSNKLIIAQETGWSGVRVYNAQGGGSGAQYKNSATNPTNRWPDSNNDGADGIQIHLTAGQKYYIEYVHHEGGGGDNVAVTYETATEVAGGTVVTDGDAPKLTGDQIATLVNAQNIAITTQPANTTVYAGTPATFTVVATNDGFYPTTYQWFRNNVAITNATGSSYSFVATPADSGATFKVELSYFSNPTPVTSSTATLTVNPANQSISVLGGLKREYFPGADRLGVENGNVGKPASVTVLTNFESYTNFADNYAERVSGLFTPAASGDYVFFVASDDDTDLFLSTDSSPAHKQLIAQEIGWSAVREYTTVPGTDETNAPQKRSDTFSPDAGVTTPFSAGIHLNAGTAYYIEAVHHEGGGGDNLAVTYKFLADPDPVSTDNPSTPSDPPIPVGDAPRFLSSELSYISSPVTTASITTQPVSASSYEGQSASFSVAVSTDSEVTPTYQWRKNGTNIVGATGSSFNLGFLSLGDAGTYDVVVKTPNLSGAAGTLTSSAATLQVFPAPLITGLLKYEYFPGKSRTDVEAGNGGTPDTSGSIVGANKSGYVTIAETADGFADNYANRFSGFFIPPATTNYVFFVYGDDDTDLFLSTDATPANKKLIAQETGASGYRAWTGADARRSDLFTGSQWPGASADPATTPTVIQLTAGQLYYIECVHHEGGGGDHVGITYKFDTEADPSNTDPYDASRLSGSVIGVKLVPPTLTSAPTIKAAYATTNGVILTFSQPIDHASVVAGNFSFSAAGAPAVTVGTPTAREVLQGDSAVTVVTVPTTGFLANTTYTINVSGVKNTAGTAVAGGTSTIATTPVLTLDFNDQTLPDGVTAGGTGAITDASGPDGTASFFLTPAVNGQQGALIISDLVSGQPVTNFTAVFKLFIGHGSGNPADGMSFNFGNIDPAVTSAGEEGVGTISIDFDTYNNGATGPGGQNEAPAFEVKLNQHIIGWVPLPQAAIVNDEWVDVIVALNPDNSITTIYNGVTYFDHLSLNTATDLVTGAAVAPYTPISGAEFLIGGRTGSEHSQQSIDDFTISENAKDGGTPPPPPTINVSSTGTGLTISWDSAATGFTLQTASSLTPPINWTTVPGVANNSVTVSTTTGNAYYRLIK